jgi:gluconate kinase
MTIVVMMGVSGSGKTTIADGIAKREAWPLLEGDKRQPTSKR